MFEILRFRKLNCVLEEVKITTANTYQLHLEILDHNRQLFGPRQNGKQKFLRLMEMVYE